MCMDAAAVVVPMKMTTKERRAKNRAIATEFVNEVNSKTPCAHCGGGPIEWHGVHHIGKENARISSLRSQGCSTKRIQKEMDLCLPLCRSCHMIEDGRLATLAENAPRQKGQTYVQPKPCSCCGRVTKRTRSGMCSTCDNHHSGRRLRVTNSCDGCCGSDEED